MRRRVTPQHGSGLLAVLGLVVALGGCGIEKNSMVAPSDVVVDVAPPATLVVVNTSAPLSIKLAAPDGSPVEDGTEVWLAASRGELESRKVRAQGGVANVMFRAPSDSGPVQITAASGDVRGQLDLAVASAPVAKITLTASPALLPADGGSTQVIATALSPQGQLVSGAPVKFQTTAGTVSPAMALTDGSGKAKTQLQTAAPAKVAAAVQGSQSVALTVALQPKLTIKASPATPTVGANVTFTIGLSTKGATGNLSLVLGNGETKDLGKVTGPTTVKPTHVYRTAGGFNATAVLKYSQGEVRNTVRVTVQPATGPPSAPLPSPSGPVDPNVPFSLSQVTWLHTNVSGWSVTSKITGVRIDDPPVCISHTKAGRWPVKNGVEGNPWVFANVNGRWYAATYEWLRPGQTCKGVRSSDIGAHTKKHPLTSWRPRSGELVGFMVSAHARFGRETVAERSNIVMVRWP